MQVAAAFAELERGVHAALETYCQCPPGQRAQLAGVHAPIRAGQGHRPGIPGAEQRQIRGHLLHAQKGGSCSRHCSSLKAIASCQARTSACHSGSGPWPSTARRCPKALPFETGGGTARLVSPGWVIWARAPDKFEAGTPAIVNVIAFAKALRLIQQFGNDAFQGRRRTSAGAAKLAATDILHHDELERYSGRELLD